MASNQYINNYTALNEQNLVENLVVESIKFYGHDVKYLPRSGVNLDKIFNENEYSNFSESYDIEVYVKNVDNYGGDGEFLSKFGLEIRHQMVLVMSNRSFDQYVKPSTGFVKPREGDLIYIPMLSSLFEIRFVEQNAIFFQMGSLQSYELTVERFEYSNENFNTGLDFDDVYNGDSIIPDINNDKFNQNSDIESEADPLLDWEETSPFGEV